MFGRLSDKLQDVFKNLRGQGKISESNITDALREVRLALLDADVHFQVAKDFIARVKEKALGESVLRSVTPGQQIVKIFHEELCSLLGGDAAPLQLDKPASILIVGLNGAGKTTSSAKLARLLKSQGRSPFSSRAIFSVPPPLTSWPCLARKSTSLFSVQKKARPMCSRSPARPSIGAMPQAAM